jgi:hypothetical protein
MTLTLYVVRSYPNTAKKTYYQVRFFDEDSKLVKLKGYPPKTSKLLVTQLAKEE